MLTLRNTIRATLLLVLAVLLIAGTATGKNERAAQRQAARQAQKAAKAEQRQARAAQRQKQNQARKQATAERRATRQEATAQKRAESQARKQANRLAAAQRRSEKQLQRQEKREVRTERREVKREQTAQKRQAKTVQRADRQIQRQENRQIRTEQRQERKEQAVQKREEKAAARNDNKRNITRNVSRDVNIQRITGPTGKKTITERNFQRTVTKNGRTFTKNFSKTVVRDTTKRFDRPRVTRPNHNTHNKYSRYNGKACRVRRLLPGRRPSGIFSHIVWPSYGYSVYYRHGSNLFVHYVRPTYHRKYVFLSVGNCWPTYYTSVRYCRYGWHPYRWYGSYPTAYEVGGDTHNYYTYNTYNYDYGTSQSYTTGEYSEPLESVDESTFEDVRQKLAEQSQEQPKPETLVDKFFEDGVVAFEQEDYETAAKAFADAIALEPNDLILPFAYVQALFAGEQYSRAADILRLALVQMPAEEQGLFFPRGLYSDDEILFGQIDKLQSKAETFVYDPDMPLLLGYQLIGAERNNEARQWLDLAGLYDLNKDATVILLDLLDKLEEQSAGVSENAPEEQSEGTSGNI